MVGAVQVQKALPKPGYLKNKPWREGRLGFTIALTTLIGSMRQTPVSFQWGVAKLPKGSQGRKAYGGPDGLVISNKPATVAPSWELIKFLIGKDAQVPLCIAWGGLPVNKAAATTPEFLGARPADYQTGLDSAPFMYDLYNANYGKWMGALSKQVNDALSGTLSAKDALTQAGHDVNAILQQVYPNG
jgi:ABC-type glycerol-3-phosphate transport system substrate-binding protein